jgi:hypothetical protein
MRKAAFSPIIAFLLFLGSSSNAQSQLGGASSRIAPPKRTYEQCREKTRKRFEEVFEVNREGVDYVSGGEIFRS